MRDVRKLTVFYTGNRHDVLRYTCLRGWLDSGEPRCIGFSGMSVDETIAKQVPRVVQPAAVEAARLAREGEAHKRDEVLEAWKRDLEAARYAAQRAQKQYDAADPENRLVADEVERRMEPSSPTSRRDRTANRAARPRSGESYYPDTGRV